MEGKPSFLIAMSYQDMVTNPGPIPGHIFSTETKLMHLQGRRMMRRNPQEVLYLVALRRLNAFSTAFFLLSHHVVETWDGRNSRSFIFRGMAVGVSGISVSHKQPSMYAHSLHVCSRNTCHSPIY